MRLPLRDVRDDDVDRLQVQGQECQSRAVLITRKLSVASLCGVILLQLKCHHPVKAVGGKYRPIAVG